MESIQAFLNQQLFTGGQYGNEGSQKETHEDWMGAAQSYDLAIEWIGQSINTAY